VESAEMIGMLQRSVDAGIEVYNLLMEGNKSLLAERDEFRYLSNDLETELASSAEKSVADLEARIKSAETHNVDVAATSEKRLRDL
jgi:hypothetical protein